MTDTKPVFFLYVFDVTETIWSWFVIAEDEFAIIEARPKQYQIHVIDGRTAKVFVCAPTGMITREKALKTASSFIFGAYKNFSLDGAKPEVTIKNGDLAFHPPH